MKNILLITLLTLFFVPVFVYAQSLELTFKEQIEFKDTIHPVYQTSFSKFVTKEGKFAFITDKPAQVSLYTLKDKDQLFYRNLEGDGPGEIRNLVNLYLSNDAIHMISRNGKILSLNLMGEIIHEHQYDLTMVKDFIVTDHYYIVSSESPSTPYYVQAIHKSNHTKKFIAIDQRIENVLMFPFTDSGAMVRNNEIIYVSEPHGNNFYEIDSSFEVKAALQLNIPDFKSSTVNKNEESYFNDMEALRGFLGENSAITGIYNIDDKFLLEIFHAHQDFNRRDILLFNPKYELLCFKTLPDNIHGVKNPKVHSADGEFVYFYREEVLKNSQFIKKYVTKYKPECT